MYRFIKTSPVIHLLLSVGTLAACPVKPHLMHLTVVGQQFGQLVYKKVVITRRVAITLRITVPRRKIHPEFHPVFVTSIPQLPHDIALAVFPRRRRYRVSRRPSRPQAKTVMMLCRKNHHLKAALLQRLHPLLRIELRRIEQPRVFRTVAPLPSRKRIDAEMQESRHFQLLPSHLAGIGNQARSHVYLLGNSRPRRESQMLHIVLFAILRHRQAPQRKQDK